MVEGGKEGILLVIIGTNCCYPQKHPGKKLIFQKFILILQYITAIN